MPPIFPAKLFIYFARWWKFTKKKIVKNRKTYKLLNPSALWIITQKIWKNILPWQNFAFYPKIMYRKSSTLNWFPFSSLSYPRIDKIEQGVKILCKRMSVQWSIIVIIIFRIISTIYFARGYLHHGWIFRIISKTWDRVLSWLNLMNGLLILSKG